MADLDVLQILRETRDLLSEPDRWTQRTVARDEDGRDLFDMYENEGLSMHDADVKACLSPDAVCWCLGGALTRAAGKPIHSLHSQFGALWDQIDDKVGPWNDTHTHADVLAVLDKAISLSSPSSGVAKEPA